MRVILLLLTEMSLFSFWLGLWSVFENTGITKNYVFSITSSAIGFVSLTGLTYLLHKQEKCDEKERLDCILECIQKYKLKPRLRNV